MRKKLATEKLEVLVVEDDAPLLELVTEALGGLYRVYGAQSLDDAQKLLASVRPQLVILDIQLRGRSGLELLREFRQGSLAPVLLMTGHGSESVAAQALDLRANAYLQKPFAIRDLRARVAELVAEGPRPEHLAERAKAILDAHAPSASVSPHEIANALGVSPRNLRAVFSARFGRSPADYQREVRLRRAQELLLTTDLPVAEIAVKTGFGDSTYFGRIFKRQLGMTPVKFRRSHVPSTEPAPSPSRNRSSGTPADLS